ncbi:MAG: phosphoribosylanthranilate isomerase [Bacteroidota bacterium]
MTKNLKIKVCGMRDPQNVKELSLLDIDYVGFIFHEKSKRNVNGIEVLPIETSDKKRVGVFVNKAVDFIEEKIRIHKLNAVQLHGDETPRFCKALYDEGVDVIKVFSIDDDFDFSITKEYEDVVNYFLFDTKGHARGGNGVVFDWSLLEKYEGNIPFILSGGLSLQSLEELKQLEHEMLFGIDLNSRFEIEPALKNIELLKTFIHELRN